MDTEPEGDGWEVKNIRDLDYSMEDAVEEVMSLRNTADEGALKPMTPDEIRENVHEFFILVMRGKPVGCFRIFHPKSIGNHVLEIGSVVSTKKGVGKIIAETAETIALELQLPIIAVTKGTFLGIIEKRGWKLRKNKYKSRAIESCKTKAIYEYSPKK